MSTTGERGDPACVGRLAPPSWLKSPLGLVACIAYVFQWVYDGKQHSIVSLGTTYPISGNHLEDDGNSVFVLSLVSETVFRTANLEMLIESAIDCLSYLLFWSARVNGEH